MSIFDNLSTTQKLRAALHRDVRSICTETCHFLGLEITKPAIEIVAELVYKKLSVYGTDLEAFAKHAKRATISAEDVKLLTRRCPSLKNRLNSIAPNSTIPKEKRRKTAASKQPETPVAKTSVSPSSRAESPLVKAAQVPPSELEPTNQRLEEDELERMIVDEIDLTFE